MAQARAKEGRPAHRARGRTVANSLPKMVTHLAVADCIGVTSETLRGWVQDDPPKFPKPSHIIGTLWLYSEEEIKAFLDSHRWPEKSKS